MAEFYPESGRMSAQFAGLGNPAYNNPGS